MTRLKVAIDLEERWLTQHGDRNSLDLLIDEAGEKFVYMGDGLGDGGYEKVYLPYFKKRSE